MILDGYIRVSQVAGRSGPSFISPSVQREQITLWAVRHEVRIARVFEELDVSGANMDRPLLEQAIRRVELGQSEGVAVAYLSRFGRSLLDGLAAIERITNAGGTFVSVQEPLDLRTDTGKLILRILFSIAEWERDRTRTMWKDARERAVARGIGSPRRSLGYRRGPDRRFIVDPTEGPVAQELFARRAGGATLGELLAYIKGTGVKTVTGKDVWSPWVIREMLSNRIYRGEIHHSGFSNTAAHEPLVDEGTWQRAQPTDLHRTVHRNSNVALLRGIARCAGCGRPLASGIRRRRTSWEYRAYWCTPGVLTGPCRAPVHIADTRIELYTEALFWQEVERPGAAADDSRIRRYEAVVEKRELELAAYRDNSRLPIGLGPERFASGLAVRRQRVDEAQVKLSRVATVSTDTLPSATELRERWPSMTVRQRRQAISQVIPCVFVFPGHRSPQQRLFACGPGDVPADLPPVLQRRRYDTRPFEPAKSRPLRLRAVATLWKRDTVREGLAPILTKHEFWPGMPAFQAASSAAVYAQVLRQGGPRAWAEVTQVPWKGFVPLTRKATMSRDRVKRELAIYLRHRTTWPTVREFARDGESQLRRGLLWFDTPENWASEFGLEMGHRQRSHTHRRRPYEVVLAELAEFVGGRQQFPTSADFGAAGRRDLYQQIMGNKWRRVLAADLGLTISERGQPWTEERIAAALDRFLKGRKSWPTTAEFQDAGLGGLRHSLRVRRIQGEWASRYGFRLNRPGSPLTGRGGRIGAPAER